MMKLSVFAKCHFSDDEHDFTTVAQYMLYVKARMARDSRRADIILKVKNPNVIKKKYEETLVTFSKDNVAMLAFRHANDLKFRQNDEMRHELMASTMLINYNMNKRDDNIYGKILMDLRDLYRLEMEVHAVGMTFCMMYDFEMFDSE